MECDACKQDNASIYLTQVIEGKILKVNLCQECADANGVNDPMGFNLANLLSGIGEETIQVQSSRGAICSNCGFSQSDFKKSGRLGCSDCYEVFEEGLESLLKAMHKGVKHVGKMPVSHPQRTPEVTMGGMSNRMELLQMQLTTSIESENYEEAARLRDELRQLKAEAAVFPEA